jgi:hypothetical protein
MKLPEGLIPAPLRRPAPPGQSNGAGRNGGGATEVAKETGADVVGWLDERTGGSSFLTAMLYR